jgi:tetratricopeptide (TPR) repeat protein
MKRFGYAFSLGLLVSVFCISASSCAKLKAEQEPIGHKSKNTTTLVNNASTYLKKGQQLSDEANYQEAIKYANKVLQINPNSSEAYLLRGNARHELENYPEAIKDFSSIIKINPNSAEAYRQRGDAHTGLGDFKKAFLDINYALQINPKYIEAYLSRALLYDMLGNHQLASKDLGDIKKLDSEIAETYERVFKDSVSQIFNDTLKTLVINHNKLLQANPNDADTYYNRGYAYAGLKDKLRAIADLKKAAELYKQQGKIADYQNALNIIKGLQ